jgi:hypothetical protein
MLQRTRKASLELKMIMSIPAAVMTSQGSQVDLRKPQ